MVKAKNTDSTNYNSGSSNEEGGDPFDCQSLSVPPARTLVEGVLEVNVKKWRDVDARKLVQDPKKKKHKKNVRINLAGRQLMLPPEFDYRTILRKPPPHRKDDDLVMDLLDPTRQTSYHQELWQLFSQVPTVERITSEDRSNADIPHTLKVYEEIVEGTKRVLRMDAHDLARLRMSDRHGLPPSSTALEEGSNNPVSISTIRLEFWKRQPRRGAAPDCRRMVLEFLASQTLLEMHKVIIQMMEDDAWTSNKERGDSGCFFIEDQFYSTGDVDYTGPILRWIDGGGQPNPARRRYLGISSMEAFSTSATSMKDIILGDIPFRLGIRYYHVTHGDVEISFSCTDKRLVHHSKMSYPIIHDIWTPPYPLPLCDCCDRFPAVYVYKDTPQEDKRKGLCEHCCSQLQLFEKEKDSLELYTIFKNKSELSAGFLRNHQGRFF
jgi:hypothetical protein